MDASWETIPPIGSLLIRVLGSRRQSNCGATERAVDAQQLSCGCFLVRKNVTHFHSMGFCTNKTCCFTICLFRMLSSTHQLFVCFWIHGIFFLPVLPPSSASKEIDRQKSTFCQSCDIYTTSDCS